MTGLSCESGCTHEDHWEEYQAALLEAATKIGISLQDLTDSIKASEEAFRPPEPERWTFVPNRKDRRAANRQATKR